MFDLHRSSVAPNVKNLLTCLSLIAVLIASVTGIDSKWHMPMTKADYHSLYISSSSSVLPQVSPSSSPSPTSCSVSVPHRLKWTSAYVPSFQGTLLAYCVNDNLCDPLFLSPLSVHSVPRLVLQLCDMSKTKATKWLSNHSHTNADKLCLSRPFSHAAHCNFIPTKCSLPASFTMLGYDWRQSFSTLLSTLSTKVQSFVNDARHDARQAEKRSRVVIVAQGTACRLVSRIISHINSADVDGDNDQILAFICLHPLRMQEAWDAFTQHVSASIVDVRQNAPRHDTSLSDLEAGLSARRRSKGWPPHIVISGPWLHPSNSDGNGVLLQELFPMLLRTWPALEDLSSSHDHGHGHTGGIDELIHIDSIKRDSKLKQHLFCVEFTSQSQTKNIVNNSIDEDAQKRCDRLFPSAHRIEEHGQNDIELIVQNILDQIDS